MSDSCLDIAELGFSLNMHVPVLFENMTAILLSSLIVLGTVSMCVIIGEQQHPMVDGGCRVVYRVYIEGGVEGVVWRGWCGGGGVEGVGVVRETSIH